MKRPLNYISVYLMLIFSALTTLGCSDREPTVSCFPKAPVNVQLNLNLPAYFPIQTIGGWMYINEQSAGTRGLIVVRTANGFNVYDRNAPHICPENNTTLEVVDNIKIVCPKDKAEWILISGQPVKVAKVSPKTYPSQYDAFANTLYIFE